MTEEGFAAMTRSIRDCACDELEVPVGCVLEGGYALGRAGAVGGGDARRVRAGAGGVRETVPRHARVDRGARAAGRRRWPILAS